MDKNGGSEDFNLGFWELLPSFAFSKYSGDQACPVRIGEEEFREEEPCSTSVCLLPENLRVSEGIPKKDQSSACNHEFWKTCPNKPTDKKGRKTDYPKREPQYLEIPNEDENNDPGTSEGSSSNLFGDFGVSDISAVKEKIFLCDGNRVTPEVTLGYWESLNLESPCGIDDERLLEDTSADEEYTSETEATSADEEGLEGTSDTETSDKGSSDVAVDDSQENPKERPLNRRMTLKEAFELLAAIRNKFEDLHQSKTYSQFLKTTMKYKHKKISRGEYMRRVITLFLGHEDLIDGFRMFVRNDNTEAYDHHPEEIQSNATDDTEPEEYFPVKKTRTCKQ